LAFVQFISCVLFDKVFMNLASSISFLLGKKNGHK